MDYPPILSISEIPLKQDGYSELGKHFKLKYDKLPKFYVRVPGRVNLIGEHIDYCGFNVLPMAIEQDIVLAVHFNDNKKINLTNIQSNIYDDFSTDIESLTISVLSPEWYHYFMCGFKGVAEEHLLSPKGLDIAIQGTIPPSSGLSSSSALVCAAALATAYANGVFLPKLEIASLCAKAERYIGTQGGGMDQAIAFLAESGTAKLIKFNPLEAVNVPLPKGAKFVVANSCVAMNKAATGDYNTRVVECKIATKILAKTYHIDLNTVNRLKDIPHKLNIPIDAMLLELPKIIYREPYTRSSICQALEITELEFETSYLTPNTQDLREFMLLDRAYHVYSEASRVEQFEKTCKNDSPEALVQLGKLMNESHDSCRYLYDCSHYQLDELVELCIEAGALGSRLTGAGWGGCCVSLVLNENLDKFLATLEEKFYKKNSLQCHSLNSALFATSPGGGAVIYAS